MHGVEVCAERAPESFRSKTIVKLSGRTANAPRHCSHTNDPLEPTSRVMAPCNLLQCRIQDCRINRAFRTALPVNLHSLLLAMLLHSVQIYTAHDKVSHDRRS